MTSLLLSDQLASTIDAVRTGLVQPEAETVATFVADTCLGDGYNVDVTIRQFALTSNEPVEIGGSDTGPTPVELVLAGLGACQEIVYATYARILGIPIDKVTIHSEGRLDLRGFYGVADVPVGFGDITFHADIESPASPEEIDRLVSAVNSHCPVLDILRQPVPVTGSWSHNGIAGNRQANA